MRAIDTTPRYVQIADALRRAIADGSLPAGERIPPAAELAQIHSVARRTAERATEQLAREGLLDSRPGAGLYVRALPDVIRLARSWYQRPGTALPWRAAMAELGRVGGCEHETAPAIASPAVAARLQIEPGADVMRTRYLYTLDDTPAFLATSWEPMDLTMGTSVMLPEAGPHAGAGVPHRMSVIGYTPTYCREENTARTLTADEAERLALHAGLAVLVVERTYMHPERPLETADVIFPPHIRAVYEIAVG